MKTHIAQNPDKTRHAVAVGKVVQFFKRKPSGKRFVSPQMWRKQAYRTIKEAQAAADAWASEGKVLS